MSTKPRWSKRLSPAALGLLALTSILSLTWSHYKLLDQDEMFVLQTDSVRTLRELVHIQLHYPISLDPLVYHALAHWSACLFGATAFALRLPSLLGFLLMQACLYVFTRRCFAHSGLTTHHSPLTLTPQPPAFAAAPQAEAAALIALAFPALTATLFYSAEARPYGLLLGFSALALVAWQSATGTFDTTSNLSSRPESAHFADAVERPASPAPASRTAALLTLTASIALALNTHYFAILLLIPLCLAEFTRTVLRRRLDFPVAAAIGIGIAAEAFTLPFQHAAAAFRRHYYNADTIGPHAITQSYRALLVDYTHASMAVQHIAAAAFALLAIALIVSVIYHRRTRTLALTTPEFVFVVALAALPFFGFMLGFFVTHTLEVRYVLGAIVGVSVFLALVFAPSLHPLSAQRAAIALTFAAVAVTGLVRIFGENRHTSETLAAWTPSPALKAALAADPQAPVYIQEMGHFEVLSYYEPDLDLRRRLTLVYSPTRELDYDHHDTEALTALHMTQFTSLPIARYVGLSHQPGEHLFLLYQGGWNWTDQAFAADHATVTPLGQAIDGEAASVRFR